MARIRREDTVQVLFGKDKGKKGRVLRVYPGKGSILVEGVNVIRKHMRPTRENPKGGISSMERPVPLGKVMYVCPKCAKPTKVGIKVLADGEKKRICKKCQEIL